MTRVPDHLDPLAYGYFDESGRFKFRPGQDAVYKSVLMRESRNIKSAHWWWAERELLRRGWSTVEREREARK